MTKMNDELADEAARLRAALEEIDDYTGGADTVLDDESVTERRQTALASTPSTVRIMAVVEAAKKREAIGWQAVGIPLGSQYRVEVYFETADQAKAFGEALGALERGDDWRSNDPNQPQRPPNEAV